MEIVCFEQKYEEELIELWNQTMIFDPVSSDKFRTQVLLDENFDRELCLLARTKDRVVGFILGIKRRFPYLERGLEPDRGWISLMFVAKEFRRRGIGTSLVCEIEKRLLYLGTETITLAAYSPNYFFPGIDIQGYPEAAAFFEARGYKGTEESYSMCKDLHGFIITPEWMEKKKAAERKGFVFRNFQWMDTLKLLDFAKTNFGGGWKRNLLLAMRAGEAEDVITVVLLQDEIVGFAMRKIDGNPMRFGPIGVCEKVRNAGIGGILFQVKQQEMCSKGIYHLYFLSTDAPGRRFYERHGVHVFRTYRKYQKSLKGD